jgi:hypothetical protein
MDDTDDMKRAYTQDEVHTAGRNPCTPATPNEDNKTPTNRKHTAIFAEEETPPLLANSILKFNFKEGTLLVVILC